uniref:Uncharacterized protein n=1 Tax=Arundo donax TaxID=35708 RepID=A0A0A9HEF1_ARUDO
MKRKEKTATRGWLSGSGRRGAVCRSMVRAESREGSSGTAARSRSVRPGGGVGGGG